MQVSSATDACAINLSQDIWRPHSQVTKVNCSVRVANCFVWRSWGHSFLKLSGPPLMANIVQYACPSAHVSELSAYNQNTSQIGQLLIQSDCFIFFWICLMCFPCLTPDLIVQLGQVLQNILPQQEAYMSSSLAPGTWKLPLAVLHWFLLYSFSDLHTIHKINIALSENFMDNSPLGQEHLEDRQHRPPSGRPDNWNITPLSSLSCEDHVKIIWDLRRSTWRLHEAGKFQVSRPGSSPWSWKVGKPFQQCQLPGEYRRRCNQHLRFASKWENDDSWHSLHSWHLLALAWSEFQIRLTRISFTHSLCFGSQMISAKSRVQHSSALNLSKAFLLATICSVAPLRGLPKWVLQQVPRAVKVLAYFQRKIEHEKIDCKIP